jgi:flagellar basal body-associated protein FliL
MSRSVVMKFDKNEKSGAKKEGKTKKLIIRIIVGLFILSLILLPMLMGGFK